MTEELLAEATRAQNNIQNIKRVLDSIERITLDERYERNYRPCLKFSNMLKRKGDKEVREAAVILFNGISMYGTELPVDERLLDCLKEHYRERLEEAKAVLDAL